MVHLTWKHKANFFRVQQCERQGEIGSERCFYYNTKTTEIDLSLDVGETYVFKVCAAWREERWSAWSEIEFTVDNEVDEEEV